MTLDWTAGKHYPFVIHLHHAKRAGLHYDVRIRNDSYRLTDFATRKNPTDMKHGDKIVLFQQPDHTLTWLTKEGQIVSGYGAGSVKIWDEGTANIIRATGNHAIINFFGNKLNGCFSLVNFKPKEYLLIKIKNQNCVHK